MRYGCGQLVQLQIRLRGSRLSQRQMCQCAGWQLQLVVGLRHWDLSFGQMRRQRRRLQFIVGLRSRRIVSQWQVRYGSRQLVQLQVRLRRGRVSQRQMRQRARRQLQLGVGLRQRQLSIRQVLQQLAKMAQLIWLSELGPHTKGRDDRQAGSKGIGRGVKVVLDVLWVAAVVDALHVQIQVQ